MCPLSFGGGGDLRRINRLRGGLTKKNGNKLGLSSAKLSGAIIGCPGIIFEVDFEMILK